MKDYTTKQLKDLMRQNRWLIYVNQHTERDVWQCIWYLKKYEAELQRREK